MKNLDSIYNKEQYHFNSALNRNTQNSTEFKKNQGYKKLNQDQDLAFTTNKELHQNLKNLVHSERKILSVIIDHLTEVYKRRMYAELGYSSLFKYCTQGLGYSDSAALRRINVLKLSIELPEVKDKIKTGHLSLSTLSQAQSFFQKAKKLQKIKYRQVGNTNNFDIISGSRNTNSETNLVVDAGQFNILKSGLQSQGYLSKIEKLNILKSLESKTSYQVQKEFIKLCPEVAIAKDLQKPVAGNLTELTLTFSDQQINKLKRLKQLRPGLRNTADLFEWLMDMGLKIENKKQDKKVKKMTPPLNVIRTSHDFSLNKGNIDRTINAQFYTTDTKVKLKQKVNEQKQPNDKPIKKTGGYNLKTGGLTRTTLNAYIQDGVMHTKSTACNQVLKTNPPPTPYCSYTSKTGHKCKETFGLEVDHIHPKAKGGTNAPTNLRWLCKAHNQLSAQEHFGQKQMGFYLN